MSDQSEEKTLPPTEHKLRKAREKGQVSSSADFVTAMLTIAGVIIVFFSATSFINLFQGLLDRAILSMKEANIATLKGELLFTAKSITLSIAPLAIILAVVALVANLVHKKGFVFSLHPIKPEFNKINPAQGIKKLFSVRNISEFGVSLFRIIIWFTAAIFIIWIWLPELISSPICGEGCLAASIISIAQWLFIAGCILLLAAGLVDLPMQMALFRRDQRMSVSEHKRELRDIMGNPEIKTRRKQLAMEDIASLEHTNTIDNVQGLLLIGEDCVVEIRFLSGVTPLPIVYAKAKGDKAYDILALARANGHPIEDLGSTTLDIYKSVGQGMPILQKHFGPVANALVKNNLV